MTIVANAFEMVTTTCVTRKKNICKPCLSIIKPIERLTGQLKILYLMPNISVRQD